MKKHILLIASFLTLTYTLTAQSISENISSVKSKYAPDSRTSIYDVKAAETSGPVVLYGETTEKAAKEALVAAVKASGKEVQDYITLLPDAKALDGKIYGVVHVSVADLRYGGSYSAEQATQLLMGMPLQVLKKDGWSQVRTPEGYIAWIPSSSFTPMTKEDFNAYISSQKVMFTPDYGWLYSEAKSSSQRVCDLVAGNVMKQLSVKGKWVKVALADGREGYVEKDKVVDFASWAKNTRPTQEAILNTAYRFIGVPYQWAGTSAKMLDCSGFAKTTYLLNGLILARDASQQCLTGQNIEITDIATQYDRLQPGDLVFWGRKATPTSRERVTHVGIYVGDGLFIHESGRVKFDSFNKNHPRYSQYYVNIFVRATRIIGTEDQGKGVTSVEKNPLYNIQK